jgi:hypothetical protein
LEPVVPVTSHERIPKARSERPSEPRNRSPKKEPKERRSKSEKKAMRSGKETKATKQLPEKSQEGGSKRIAPQDKKAAGSNETKPNENAQVQEGPVEQAANEEKKPPKKVRYGRPIR